MPECAGSTTPNSKTGVNVHFPKRAVCCARLQAARSGPRDLSASKMGLISWQVILHCTATACSAGGESCGLRMRVLIIMYKRPGPGPAGVAPQARPTPNFEGRGPGSGAAETDRQASTGAGAVPGRHCNVHTLHNTVQSLDVSLELAVVVFRFAVVTGSKLAKQCSALLESARISVTCVPFAPAITVPYIRPRVAPSALSLRPWLPLACNS